MHEYTIKHVIQHVLYYIIQGEYTDALFAQLNERSFKNYIVADVKQKLREQKPNSIAEKKNNAEMGNYCASGDNKTAIQKRKYYIIKVSLFLYPISVSYFINNNNIFNY